MIATISNDVPTGRSMKIRDGFMSRKGYWLDWAGRPAPPLRLSPAVVPVGVPVVLPVLLPCWPVPPRRRPLVAPSGVAGAGVAGVAPAGGAAAIGGPGVPAGGCG